MSTDVSGTYSLPSSDIVNGQTADATPVQNNFDDIEAGLTERLTKTGKTTPTANLPMGNYRHTAVGAAAARTDYARTDQAQDSSLTYALTTGTDTIVAALSPVITAYGIGQTLHLKKSAAANTGAVSLNVNSVGAGTVTWPDGTGLSASDLPANCMFTVSVQATTPVFHLQSVTAPPGLSKGTLTTRGDIMVRDATVTTRLPVGAANTVLKSNGTDPSWGTVMQVVRVQAFTGSGTYTPHAAMLYCQIEAVGGGGGGGGIDADGNAMSAGGGGAGGYSRKLASAADIGASKTVTIGAAGTAGSAGDNDGGSGGATSVGTLCIANGGSGGEGMGPSPDTAQGGLGGVSAGGAGDLIVNGEPGDSGSYVVLASGFGTAGNGGSSRFGGGGRGRMVNGSTQAGTAATGYGSGGSGAVSRNDVATAAGGAGTAGYVIVTEYCSS